MSKKKKIIILSVMLVLLVATGYLNIVLNNQVTDTPATSSAQAGFFETYRTDRESTRNESMLYLEAILASSNTSADAKATAESQMAEIVATMEQELIMEGLIKAKGFDEVVVTTSSSLINVIVKSSELTKSEVAQIVQVVKEQTGKGIDNIKVIPVE